MPNRPKRPGVTPAITPTHGKGMVGGQPPPMAGQWLSTADPSAGASQADLLASSQGAEVPSMVPDATTPQTLQYTPKQTNGWDTFRNIISLGASGRQQAAFDADQQKQALLYNTGEANNRADTLFGNTTALKAKQDTERAGRVIDEKTQEDLLNEQAGRTIRGNLPLVKQLSALGINVSGVGDAQDGFLLRHMLGGGQVGAGMLNALASGARDAYGAGKTTAMIPGAPAEGEAQQDANVTGYQADTSRNVLSRIGTDAQMSLAGDVARGAQGNILDTQALGKLTTAQAKTYAELHPNQAAEDAHLMSVGQRNRLNLMDVPASGAMVHLDAGGSPNSYMQMGGMDMANPLAKPKIQFGDIGAKRPAPIKLDAGQVRSFLSAPPAPSPVATNASAMTLPNSTAQQPDAALDDGSDASMNAIIQRIKALRGMRTQPY